MSQRDSQKQYISTQTMTLLLEDIYLFVYIVYIHLFIHLFCARQDGPYWRKHENLYGEQLGRSFIKISKEEDP